MHIFNMYIGLGEEMIRVKNPLPPSGNFYRKFDPFCVKKDQLGAEGGIVIPRVELL